MFYDSLLFKYYLSEAYNSTNGAISSLMYGMQHAVCGLPLIWLASDWLTYQQYNLGLLEKFLWQ